MLRRVGVSMTVLAALVLSACGVSDNKSDDKPAPGPSSSSTSYEGKEIKETPCGPRDAGAVIDYATPLQINTGRLRGELGMRMSTLAGGCDHFFWARFIPSGTNKRAYIVSVENLATGTKYEQESASNRTVDALTKGTHVTPGTAIKVCVRVRGLRVVDANCLLVTNVV